MATTGASPPAGPRGAGRRIPAPRGGENRGGTMADDAGKMPEQYVHQPAPPLDVKVRDLVPEHGVGFLGVYDLAVDTDRRCWVRLDAPVFGADFEQVAPILIRRARDGGYEI